MDNRTPADGEPVVDPTQPMRDQAIQMAMILEDWYPNIVTYRHPLDMSSPESVANVKSELGPAAVMPTDPNGYYLYLLITDRTGNRVPVFLPMGEVRTALFLLAVREDSVRAQAVAFYPWLLP